MIIKGGNLKRILLLSFTILIAIFFQNCSGSNSHLQFFTNEGASKLEAESGNGTGYGGKLTQNFYHYVPGYECEGKPYPFAKLEYSASEENSLLITNKDNQCMSISNPVANASIDRGALQNKVVGLGERIFEFSSADKVVIPDSPVEIWCVDQWEKPTFEILSRYNNSQKKAETEFYFPNVAKRIEVNPARVVSQQSVHLNSNYFDLFINKENSGTKSGTFIGILNRLGDKDQPTQLQCRLGSYLDARLWPAKVVNFDDLQQMEWSPTEGQFYLITGHLNTAWSENILASYTSDGRKNKVLINNTSNSHGVRHFEFSKDRTNILLQAHLIGDNSIQLYSLNPKSDFPPVRLNSKLTEWGQAVSGEFIPTSSNDFVYYLDGAQETGGDIEQWLRAVSIKTGQIYQINQNLVGADVGVGQFEISNSLNKVVYSTGFAYHDIWIADKLGGNQRQVNLAAHLGADYMLEWYMKKALHWQFIDDRYLVLIAMPRDGFHNRNSKLLVIDLNSENVVFKKDLNDISFYLNPIYSLPIISISNLSGTNFILDLTTMTLISKEQIISKYENSPSLTERILAYDLMIKTSQSLCGNEDQIISRLPLGRDRWLILKKGTEALTHIYMTTSFSETCVRINQILLSEEALNTLKSTDSQNSIPLTGSIRQNSNSQISIDEKSIIASFNKKLFYIPTDQKPIVEIYTPLNSIPVFEEFGFTNNEKIYFKGQVISNYVSDLFLWNIPKN